MTISWLNKSSYDRVKNTARNLLYKQLQLTQPANQRVYRQNAYRTSSTTQLLKVEEDGTEVPLGRAVVNFYQQWAERIPMLVGHHALANPWAELLLRITWKFDVVTINGHDGTNLATKVDEAIRENSVLNWRNECFLPRAELEAIFTDEIICKLINMDTSLSEMFGGSDACTERTDFAMRVSNFATRLLATCIHARQPLSCLYNFVCVTSLQDVNLPLLARPEVFDKYTFNLLQGGWERFPIYRFHQRALKRTMQAGGYETIPEGVVVPIFGGRFLGQGGFGYVREVRIHPDHHDFDEVR